MAVTSSDKALLGGAAVLMLGSAGFFGYLGWKQASAPVNPIPRVELAAVPYEPAAAEAPPVKTETWNAPGAQSRGREWIYDAFTPPEIFYNARSRQFTVKPPSSLLDEEALEPFGLELIAVRPEPFRLQLVGYVGDEGRWRGTFLNGLTGEVFLGSAGQGVPKLGLTITAFEVKPQPIALPESMTTRQRVATAVVRDEKSGREIVLTHRERSFTGRVTAFVSVPPETVTREVREGDVFKVGDATYRIEKVQTTPPAVEATKESPTLGQPERRTLTPREADVPEGDAAPPGGGP